MYAHINVSLYVDTDEICGNFNFDRICLQMVYAMHAFMQANFYHDDLHLCEVLAWTIEIFFFI